MEGSDAVHLLSNEMSAVKCDFYTTFHHERCWNHRPALEKGKQQTEPVVNGMNSWI